jgi:hypothetical protein
MFGLLKDYVEYRDKYRAGFGKQKPLREGVIYIRDIYDAMYLVYSKCW